MPGGGSFPGWEAIHPDRAGALADFRGGRQHGCDSSPAMLLRVNVSGLPLGFEPLLGTEEAGLDDKNRLIFSKKKRERLGDGFVVTVGPKGCLEAFPSHIWNNMVAKLLSQDELNEGVSEYTSLLLGWADDDLKFDAQGRVVIPHRLRSKADIKKDVVIVGCGNRCEIWAKEEHEKYEKDRLGYGLEKRSVWRAARKMMEGEWPE